MRACELCAGDGGEPLHADATLRVVAVDDALHPGFCRVIWQQHVREMTDLDPSARAHLMQVVFATEQAMREVLAPAKINLASLGNLTPHLHWHVIARFRDDPHFPAPVWAAPSGRAAVALPAGWRAALRQRLAELLPGGAAGP
ncbi:MAG: HIT family protein [Pseudomonadota bacterium]|nr:HIT family protein [Pseudomonadota bacterium]